MENRITTQEMMPGVFQLTDRMGMHAVLLVGQKSALLVDTGYGFDDLNAAVRAVTGLPLRVLCTHGHHDHACGNYQFDQVAMSDADMEVARKYAGGWRERVWAQAVERGIDLSDWRREDFLAAGPGACVPIGRESIALGGMTAEVYPMPGHTPGSLELFIPERGLLLPGDNWNETTWLFFDEACPLEVYRRTLRETLEWPFERILPPHNDHFFTKDDLKAFYADLEPERLKRISTPAPEMKPGTRVYRAAPAGRFCFCFDMDKA